MRDAKEIASVPRSDRACIDALDKISVLAAAGEYLASDGDMQLASELFAYIETAAKKAMWQAQGITNKE